MQPDAKAHQAAIWSSPCLWLIGVTLFLPTVRGCHAMQSPAQLIREQPLLDGGLLAPFLVAELLAILTLLPLLQRLEPSRRQLRVMLAVVAPAFASPAVFVYAGFEHGAHERVFAWGGAVAIAAALALLVAGARYGGWRRHRHLVGAFTLLTLPLAVFLVLIVVEDGRHAVSIGAYTFLAAMLGLTLLTVSTLRAITRA